MIRWRLIRKDGVGFIEREERISLRVEEGELEHESL